MEQNFLLVFMILNQRDNYWN